MDNVVVVRKELAPIYIVVIDRPERKNAVDKTTAEFLHKAFLEFDQDDAFSVAILTGAGGDFCAGADLKAMLKDGTRDAVGGNPLNTDMTKIGPMGCSRLQLTKPVVAAISGAAVAGGLELACWCDIRVADNTAFFGVYCRSKGVPLIDGGTVRLPRLIGASRASDLILTGREVKADEALRIGLVNYLVDTQTAKSGSAELVMQKALEIARAIASHPQLCLRNDRLSMLRASYALSERKLMEQEFALGMNTLADVGFGKEVKAFITKSHI